MATPVLSPKLNGHNTNNNHSIRLKNKTPSPSPIKRSDPLNSLSVAAAAAASSLRHSFNVNNNNYSLNHPQPSGLPDTLKGSFKGRGRHNGLSKQKSNATGNENRGNHGRFQRTLSLDGQQEQQLLSDKEKENGPGEKTVTEEEESPPPQDEKTAKQMPQGGNATSNGTGGKNGNSSSGKNKRLMFSGSKFSQNSLSFDMRDSSAYSQQHLKKSHSENDSAGENELDDAEAEGEVVLRKKSTDFDPMTCDECDGVSRAGSEFSDRSSTGILSSLISTSQRNSQLRSTLSKARHHLSFEKWRSSSSHSHQYQPNQQQQQQQQSNQSATPNRELKHSQDCNSANHSTSSAYHNHSNSSANSTPPTPNESPGGRLSRWFSIRRGSSHHYDLNGSSGSAEGRSSGLNANSGGGAGGGNSGRDVRDGSSGASSRLNSINNEHELAEQIQQQLHQSLSKVISQANGLQQLQQQSAQITSTGGGGGKSEKMPLVAEHEEEESYNAFGLGMSYRTTSTLKAATPVNPSQLLTPMPPAPPGLSQQQLKRRHIVAAIAHSEMSYVATLGRLVNVSIESR